MRNKFIFADTTKCVGCLSCELACAASFAKIAFEEAYTTSLPLISRNRVIKMGTLTAPTQCMHCETPSCLNVCPHGVITQMENFVKIDETACVGCGTCALICPYGAIKMIQKNNRRIALKCNLCNDHLEGPSCIRVCTTEAISLVDYDTFEAKMAEREKRTHA